MRYFILPIIIVAIFLVGCAQPGATGSDTDTPFKGSATPAEQQLCETDADCVPLPTCHPRACINREYEKEYTKPQMCTELFDCSAAYTEEDCLCVQGMCRSKNLDNQGCKESYEESDTDKNFE